MINVTFEPMTQLYQPVAENIKDLFKGSVVQKMKDSEFIGTPEAYLQINLEGDSESDIVIRKVDPRESLGYRIFKSKEDHYRDLDAQMAVPSSQEGS